ncbi:unnamed protein product [Linum tenue]|uniref:Uncharacterized protein n=1 Tax=Linum tenue TaxID=586396 RepID=A0AAV0Q752_9ROSI|nr:unnamed protein product [Linum tenue]
MNPSSAATLFYSFLSPQDSNRTPGDVPRDPRDFFKPGEGDGCAFRCRGGGDGIFEAKKKGLERIQERERESKREREEIRQRVFPSPAPRHISIDSRFIFRSIFPWRNP